MSEDDAEKKPRLQLSRDLKPPPPTPSATPDQAQASPPPPKLRPRLSAPTGAPSGTTEPVAPKTPSIDDAPPPVLGEKKPEIPHKLPPELPSQPASAIDEGSGEKLEDDLGELEKQKHRTSTFASIIIVVVLLLILAAAGGGIWWVLKAPNKDTTQDTPVAETQVEATEARTSIAAPITKAKKTITSIPVAEVPDLRKTEPRVSPKVHSFIAPPRTPTRTTTPSASNEMKEAVSAYLNNVHIGGVRMGTRAKVMIDGDSYEIGDIVDEATGLKFAGTRDGRLVFSDSNGIFYVKSF
jgi:hypothetical protein